MKKWFSENKKAILLSLAATMLPTIAGLFLWNLLPNTMITHWGADGVADGMSSKAFVVFGFPAILAALDLLALVATAADNKQPRQNRKAMRMIFWIIPLISWVVCSVMFSIALGKSMDVVLAIPLLMGVLFLIMGNYLPKVKQNSTLGIKIFWTLNNEENWNKTHRMAGKLWVIGGVILLVTILLPAKWMVAIMLADILVMIAVPMLYSYGLYKKHKAEGVDYTVQPDEKGRKKASAVLLILVLAGVVVVMFTGEITCTLDQNTLRIEATYAEDLTISYADIDTVELRETFDIGVRSFGFSSAKLSTGIFQNDEWKDYTLYAYNACDCMILIRSEGKVLAINAKTTEETQKLYADLMEKAGK